MRHVGLDDHAPLAGAARLTAEIDGIVVPVTGEQPQRGQPPQVAHGFPRRETDREQGRIGGHDHLLLCLALQSQLGHAECPVLIDPVEIQVRKGRFRDPPRHPMPPRIFHLDGNGAPRSLVQERIRQGALKDQRHEVFEHRPRPAEENPAPTEGRVGAAQRKPVLEGNIPPGNRDKAAQSRLAGQQIVECPVAAALGHVVADGEQPALGIVEKTHVDLFRQGAAIGDEPFRETQDFTGEPARCGECLQHPVEPREAGPRAPGAASRIPWRRGMQPTCPLARSRSEGARDRSARTASATSGPSDAICSSDFSASISIQPR